MGAKDSKPISQYSEKSVVEDDFPKSNDKRKTRTQKHLTQKFESKLSANAEEFSPSGILLPPESETVKHGKYSSHKDDAWMQFLVQKERERQARSPGQIPKAPQKQPILLHTAEYLKLLKSTDGTQRQRTRNEVATKTDISAAVDEIIQARCKTGKALGKTIGKDDTLMSIVKLFESKATTPEVIHEKTVVAAVPKHENVDVTTDVSTQDDIMLDKLNQDEDLTEPVYWSEDEKARKSPHRASTHKLGRRPRHDPAIRREYVMQDLDSHLDSEVAKLLLNANRLGARHKKFEKNQQVRYIVSGLKDVCRLLKFGKVKCVFVAPDIEDSTPNGGVNDRLREILGSAYQRDVPVVFSLSRSRLGLAFGKSLKMSVVGLLETKGIQDQFDHMLVSAYKHRKSWMERELP